MWMILFFVLFLLLASAGYAAWRGAPWVPTWKQDIQRIERLAQLKNGDLFVELGCGTGRVCRQLAKNTHVQVVGVELSVVQWLYAFVLRGRSGIVFGDAFYYDLRPYRVVYMFLMPETYQKISNKLQRELQPGARVITYVWPIPGWKPVVVDHEEGRPDLFVYEI